METVPDGIHFLHRAVSAVRKNSSNRKAQPSKACVSSVGIHAGFFGGGEFVLMADIDGA
jgi:hypothetical protein